jgi:hypothetical protein
MKKIVLTFGLLYGVYSIGMFLIGQAIIKNIGYDGAEIFGYTSIIIASAFVFVGIRSYRENYNGGVITFGKAFQVGILIAAAAACMYAISWEFIYHFFMPTFIEDYAAYMIDHAKAAGASDEMIKETIAQGEYYKEVYKNPVQRFGLTFLESFPIGLAFTLISAGILRKKEKTQAPVV